MCEGHLRGRSVVLRASQRAGQSELGHLPVDAALDCSAGDGGAGDDSAAHAGDSGVPKT